MIAKKKRGRVREKQRGLMPVDWHLKWFINM